ncbi:MAG: cation:proton antiporter [Vicinamibacterales bacterium]
MNQLLSLGLILLLALLAGHLVRVVRIPEVTGYLLAGVVLGPSVLGWLSEENLISMSVFSEVALGLILFSVGTVFEFALFRRIGRHVLLLTLGESAAAAALVTGGMLALGQPWQVALLLGTIATATAPASTLMVIRESDSAGPLTDSLLGVVAVNNVFCITAFSIAAAAIELMTPGGAAGFLVSFYRSAYLLAWQLVGSVALGFLIGLLLAGWSSQVTESGEVLILLAGSILLCVGVSRALDLSPFVASLAVGATMVNLAERSSHLAEALSATDPPFYAIFFVIAGAELDTSLVPAMGAAGLVYVVGRAGGKLLGARAMARWLGLDRNIQQYLGLSLLAQAGLAIGLTLSVNARFPGVATQVSTIVLASVAIYEMIGPVSTRFALGRAGEVTQARTRQAAINRESMTGAT